VTELICCCVMGEGTILVQVSNVDCIRISYACGLYGHPPGRGAECCDQRVSMSVCLSARVSQKELSSS